MKSEIRQWIRGSSRGALVARRGMCLGILVMHVLVYMLLWHQPNWTLVALRGLISFSFGALAAHLALVAFFGPQFHNCFTFAVGIRLLHGGRLRVSKMYHWMVPHFVVDFGTHVVHKRQGVVIYFKDTKREFCFRPQTESAIIHQTVEGFQIEKVRTAVQEELHQRGLI